MTSNIQNAGLLTLRVGVGGVLIAHGVQKLFGWLGGAGLTGPADAFEQMGFRPGRQSAIAAGLGEAGGGALIVLGLATPAAGATAAGTMIPAAAFTRPAVSSPSAAAMSTPPCSACPPPPWLSPGRAIGRSMPGWVTVSTRRGWRPPPFSHPPAPPRWFCSIVARH